MATQSEYIPGVCNINREEIASRRAAGHIGLALTIVPLAVLLLLQLNRYTRLILFVPLYISAIGYLQAKNKFCVGYAAAGQHNADAGSTLAQDIEDDVAITADKARARHMNIQAGVIATFITIILLFI